MARHRGDLGARSGRGISKRRAGAARDRLSEAVAELRGLTGDQLLQALERLADADAIGSDSSASVESVRRLRLWSAEHLRLAAELEAAARCCRIIEQELRQQIDAVLTGRRGQAGTLSGRVVVGPPVKSQRGLRLADWLRAISAPRHPARDQPDEELATILPVAPQPLPVASPTQLLPIPKRSEADISALILGPFELSVAGRPAVRWNSLKARAVFQYLLIHHGRPVRRDVLMELGWPGHTHTSARNNLNVALYSLRNTLKGPWHLEPILYRDGCYGLNPDLRWWIDRDNFLSALNLAHQARISHYPRQAIHHYRAAVKLYRGQLFEDDLSGDWYLTEQRHLNELYLQALESLGKIHFELGELTSAKHFGQLALQNDPCCEPVHRLLMRCYASEHQQQLVTRQYHFCVNALRDELGVSPGAETIRLFRDLTSAAR
jgi:DNA-binding SARP family transcriptional activator